MGLVFGDGEPPSPGGPAGADEISGPEWAVPGYAGLRELGSGAFGRVVLARHDVSGTMVAIKYLHRTLLEDPAFVTTFRAEARVLASLDDRNVVRLYEYVESPAGAAIVMELVDGVSLREILSHQGQTTAEAALVVLHGSLLGLAAAHARGVVHRDYKPENVLVNGQGVSKLTDFGIAARAGDRPIPRGTLSYAPPEQFSGTPASPAGDVYAATATFYECLTGHPPFTGDSDQRLLYQHLYEPVPLDPVPEPLRPLVAAGLAKDPGDRPADAAAFVASLRTAAWGVYGQDWEDRGRSNLSRAALLLAALWPSGSAPAVDGSAAEKVSLSRQPQDSRESRHLRHTEHLRHLEHLGRLRRLRLALIIAVVAAVAAAGVALAITSGSPHRPSAPNHPAAAGRPGPPVSIPVTATSGLPPVTGDVYVGYHGGKDSSAQVSGEITGAVSGDVARLFAQQFPYTSAPAPAGSLTLHPAGRTAMYAFQVTPTLATRYTVEVFRSSTSTTPLATSATSTIYVVPTGTTTYSQNCIRPVCHLTATYVVYMPPQALNTEMSKHWYVYFGVNLAPSVEPGPPAQLQLGADDPIVGPPQRISANKFERSVSFTYQIGNDAYRAVDQWCTKDTEAQDGIGLPGPHSCGSQRIPYPIAYIG
jgi:serine/threonine protein kinase